MRKNLLFILLIVSYLTHAQQIHLSGFVSDADNGERIIGANVYRQDRSKGTSTDQKGYFNLTADLPATICVSCIGYHDTCFIVNDMTNVPLQVRLRPHVATLGTAEVKAERLERKTFNTLTLNAKNIEQIPTIGSRPDIIKAAQQLPGIEGATEASSLMLVRGGNPGENLYLLDNVPLIYVNHLGGFMSVFNAEMINTMDIYKGGFPARFGGKLSSIVDLTTKNGDPTRLKGTLSAGLTDLAFAAEGPGGLKNSSFIVTGRKTLTEALLYIASEISKETDAQEYDFIYGFHDINAKYTWTPNAKNSFAFNIYEGDDYIHLWKHKNEKDDLERNSTTNIWGNLLVSGQWSSAISQRLFANNTLSFTQYRLKNASKSHIVNTIDTIDFFTKALSRVSDVSLRSDWKLHVDNAWTVEYGLQSSYLNYLPDHFSSSYTALMPSAHSHVFDNALYLDNKLKLGRCMEGSVGLRLNGFVNGNYQHWAIEPRLNLNFHFGSSLLNLTAMRVTQNAHLLMTPGSIMNNEIWIPAD